MTGTAPGVAWPGSTGMGGAGRTTGECATLPLAAAAERDCPGSSLADRWGTPPCATALLLRANTGAAGTALCLWLTTAGLLLAGAISWEPLGSAEP